MSLLKELVKETAITTAHDIGGHAGHQTMVDRKRRGSSLFKGGPIRRPRNSVSSAYRMPESQIKSVPSLNRWNWRILGEMVGKPQFDASDVMSKLDAAEKRARDEQDTVPFGLEDEDGNIIKVYVKAEEADEFESALAAMLAGEDEDEDDENSGMEIAEVLFQLKDRFQIVDVEWPNIEGDPEEEQEVAGEPGAAGGAPGGYGHQRRLLSCPNTCDDQADRWKAYWQRDEFLYVCRRTCPNDWPLGHHWGGLALGIRTHLLVDSPGSAGIIVPGGEV